VIYRMAPFGCSVQCQGRARGFVTGMLAICLSASLDARSVCNLPLSTGAPTANAASPNEPTRPDLHIPRLVCCARMMGRWRRRVDERLQTRHHAGSRCSRSPGYRSASATIKRPTLEFVLLCRALGAGSSSRRSWPYKRASHSSRRSAGLSASEACCREYLSLTGAQWLACSLASSAGRGHTCTMMHQCSVTTSCILVQRYTLAAMAVPYTNNSKSYRPTRLGEDLAHGIEMRRCLEASFAPCQGQGQP
jgi:hypothetical protein